MKAIERRQQERLLRTWKVLWQKLCEIGPASESFEDVQAFGNVGDYILDQIAMIESLLHNAKLPRHNPSDNLLVSGEENA